MRKSFCKSSLFFVAGAIPAVAYSLYDAAPMIGLLESSALTYSASANIGYDTNPDGRESGEEGRMYVNGSLSVAAADIESVNKLVYNASIGATHYLGDADSSGRQWFADCSASARFSHAFSARSRYSAALSLSYQPEADYANGISSARRQGDVLSWSFNNSYKEAIDSRWSWSVDMSTRGVKYSDSAYSHDDRQYLSGGLSLYYRESALMTYVLTGSYQYDMRSKGYDSQNVFINGGFDRSLDPFSSISVRLGAQIKMVEDDNFVSPTVNIAYNRRMSAGLSMRFFVSYRDENVNTYRGGANYYSSPSWRAGLSGKYRISPDVAFNFGVTCMYTTYEKGEIGLSDETRISWNPYVGMDYALSKHATANVTLRYYNSEVDRNTYNYKYDRWNISAGVRYSF